MRQKGVFVKIHVTGKKDCIACDSMIKNAPVIPLDLPVGRTMEAVSSMILFILTFFLVYGGLHLLVFLRIRAAFLPGAGIQLLLVALLICGLMAPFLIRLAERYGLQTLAWIVSWAGYLWMGLVLLFFAASLTLDLYRLAIWAAGFIRPFDASALLPSARVLFLLPLAVATAAAAYGFCEARRIRPEQIVICSEKIPPAAGPIRIVQISDVHVGVLIRGQRLAGMLRAVREAAPDLVVSTGDLVDGQLDSMVEAAAQLREIRPRFGKFAVTGNHEFYAGFEDAARFTRDAGFTLLRGEVADIAGMLTLAGVDDPAIRRSGSQGGPSDRDVLASAAEGRFTILLKHQPLVETDAPGRFDLQLSGHTHRGQIFPFSLVTRLVFPFHSGDFPLANGARIHVSRGTGTWGPPIRFLSPPEITVIDLLPARGPQSRDIFLDKP
jgi:predicted MPP superfamily phosphohydrolase